MVPHELPSLLHLPRFKYVLVCLTLHDSGDSDGLSFDALVVTAAEPLHPHPLVRQVVDFWVPVLAGKELVLEVLYHDVGSVERDWVGIFEVFTDFLEHEFDLIAGVA